MSLKKQMVLFITSLLMILLIGTFLLNVNHTRTFLQDQAGDYATKTATQLGLSLRSVKDQSDSVTMRLLCESYFRGGYYQFIHFVDMEGKPLTDEKGEKICYFNSSTSIEGIPDFFIKLVSIETPIAEASLQRGWLVDKVRVQQHPGLAYVQLWDSTLQLFYWFVFAAIIAVLVAWYAIKYMLSPLRKLEDQARAIIDKEYIIQDNLPVTTEFKQVVSAINGMVVKLKSIFERDAKMVEKLQRIAYEDKVTGLSNRHHFDMLFPALVDNEDIDIGAVALFRIHNLKEFNDKYGYLHGDKLVALISHEITQSLKYPNSLNARMNGSELIVVVPNLAGTLLTDRLNKVIDRMDEVVNELGTSFEDTWINIAYCDYQQKQPRGQIMGNLDFAMDQAERLGKNKHFYYSTNNAMAQDINAWNQQIDEALEHGRFTLFEQTAFEYNGTRHSAELFVRLRDAQGTILSAGSFMPAVEQLNRQMDIDREVISLATQHIFDDKLHGLYSINISAQSLFDNHQRHWINEQIRRLGKRAQQIAFEIPESVVADNLEMALPILQAYQAAGVKIGLDHFGSRLSGVQYLCDLKPDYIKLNASFARAIREDEITQDYLGRLCELTRDLSITLIAMAVEDPEQQEAFHNFNLDICQGSLLEAPKPLKE